jgi:hypothetical protein
MSTDLENLTASFGLVKREFRDVHSVVSRMDHQMRRPGARGALLAEEEPAFTKLVYLEGSL